MRLVVLSPEEDFADEPRVVAELVSLGLTRYHVRKPGWERDRVRALVNSFPVAVQTRCVLHSHHDLINELPLLGRHWRDDSNVPLELGPGFTSRSCHDVAGLTPNLGRFSALFLSPIFASISKPGYSARFTLGAVPALLQARNERERRTEVIALGGVTPDRIADCSAWGFDGVAVLGWIWRAPDPVAAFKELQEPIAAIHAS